MPVSVVQRFIEAVNAHDVDAIGACIADDHVMIDAHGEEVRGRAAVLQAWKLYFNIFADYHIEIDEMYGSATSVAVFGHASASLSNGKGEKSAWRLPSAWKAHVIDGLIAEWHIYADTKEPYDIITAAGRSVE